MKLEMDNLQGTPNAFYCEQTQMFGKAFTVVGKKPLNAEMAMTRIGLPLEIVPLKDPKQSKLAKLSHFKFSIKTNRLREKRLLQRLIPLL